MLKDLNIILLVCGLMGNASLTCFGSGNEPQSCEEENHGEEIPQNENKIYRDISNYYINWFAETCCKKEGVKLVKVEAMNFDSNLHSGRQNKGIYEVYINNPEKRYIIKVVESINTEFPSAQMLHEKLKGKDISPNVKFAYPKYMSYVYARLLRKNDKITDVVAYPNVRTYPKDDVLYELGDKLPSNATIPSWAWRSFSMLFMDKALGVPGNYFMKHLSDYTKDRKKQVFQNLAHSANAAYEFIRLDDMDNTSNIMIDPETGIVTYIDFDKLGFYFEDSKKYCIPDYDKWQDEEIITENSDRSMQRDYKWFFGGLLKLQDAEPNFESDSLDLVYSFLKIIKPELVSQAMAYVQISAPQAYASNISELYDLSSKFYELADKISFCSLDENGFSRIKDQMIPNLEKYFQNCNKQLLLDGIKIHAEEKIKKHPLWIELVESGRKIKEIGNFYINKILITGEEIFGIILSKMPDEIKKQLEKIYLLSIPKPLLDIIANNLKKYTERAKAVLVARYGLKEQDIETMVTSYSIYKEIYFVKKYTGYPFIRIFPPNFDTEM